KCGRFHTSPKTIFEWFEPAVLQREASVRLSVQGGKERSVFGVDGRLSSETPYPVRLHFFASVGLNSSTPLLRKPFHCLRKTAYELFGVILTHEEFRDFVIIRFIPVRREF